MKLSAKKVFLTVSAVVSMFLLNINSVFAAFQFDKDGRIKSALGLPEASPVDMSIKFVQWALGLIGLIVVIYIIAGGIMWMTAGGNEEKVMKAKKIITFAVIGLIIVTLSWAIVIFFVNTTKNVTT